MLEYSQRNVNTISKRLFIHKHISKAEDGIIFILKDKSRKRNLLFTFVALESKQHQQQNHSRHKRDLLFLLHYMILFKREFEMSSYLEESKILITV